ncbi:hypothetical protein [uncultured Secundilactobacillus sp.]|uniref:hypothetical protein n=1 Tax=uncultured Secundilactobacillus sp. TaxID=2813935 RepID=UPI00258D8472|nr:hypothetical protein [uncultured Secundilactobacillus sp.]
MKIADILNETEFDFLKSHFHSLEFKRDYSDDELIEIEEKIDDLYVGKGFTKDGELTELGQLIEPIVDKISES